MVETPATGGRGAGAGSGGDARADDGRGTAGTVGEPWASGLGYPAWFEAVGPQAHRLFNWANRWFSCPALRMGLGPLVSSPATGYLMLLRTRGRTSGKVREAPLGYLVDGDAVYCMAGFGRRTHWLRNVLEEPRVEVVLPGRSFSGEAHEVTDPAERRRVLVPLVRSMGLVVIAIGLGNPWREPPEVLEGRLAEFPLVRIRATGIAAGPHDPGGWGWLATVAGASIAGLWLARRRSTGSRRPASTPPTGR